MNEIVIVRRVRALIARADRPGTPPPEAATARAIADQLVRKHGPRTLDPGQAMREPPPPARTPIVHWMNGFTPSGPRQRTWCRCG